MRMDAQNMKVRIKSFITEYAARVHAETSTLPRQLGLYLVLLVFFSIAIHPATFTCHYLVQSWGLVCRQTIWVEVLVPGLANAIVMPIAVRARTLFFYMLITFVLTYILGIAYFLALLDAIYRHPMDGPGFVIFWEMSWFGGAVAGIFIKFLLETRNQIRRYEGLIY